MKSFCSFLFLLFGASLSAQDTFSIVAVDSVTHEVGSAGASCLEAPNPPQGCFIISDVIPGKGAIHTQAQWNSYNQVNAHGYLDMGYSARDILYHVNLDDYDSDSTIRQYGIAMFDTAGHVETAGYTGTGCFDYKNHISGTYYNVQGNILLGRFILDSIESRFQHTSGPMAERLMAALQGANVAGADSRCSSEGVPAQSSFVRVARPTDNPDSLYLNLVVISRPYGMSPIDSLQTLFNHWRATHPVTSITEIGQNDFDLFPNPATSACTIKFASSIEKQIEVYDMLGNLISERKCFSYTNLNVSDFKRGIYIIRCQNTVRKLVVQ